ncbi:Hsp20/alpha crystallin family protein [Dactylosporangium fulvum]|uniref:Hsp20/alpha crystallin family protein n=1 Tax=Dactylosporangium fulvum TaxID=53359 RepID=A0ABY5VUT3_9ACTN|nr:Hsp20/alpha crystallin family protein [Dactylosporangium fulvum]UWP80856.1 Hsp20/alpha crystallin family protein [Dactylosporangium fulvum]
MLLRTAPFRDFDTFAGQFFDSTRRGASAPLDAYRDGDTFYVEIDLPGVDPASIDATVDRNVLTVRAERTRAQREGLRRVITERATGTVTRRLVLGDSLDTDRLEANYDNGVLTLSIPVAEKARPRKIEIGTANRELASA